MQMKDVLSKNKLFFGIGIVGIILLIWFLLPRSGEDNFQDILTAEVKRGDLVIKVRETGELVAQNQATISAINDKQILYLAPEGTWVEEGDTLVKFESEKYEIYAQEAESALRVAKAEYQRALNELEAQRRKEEAAKKEYETLPALAAKGYVVESEVEQARLAYLEMKAKTKSLESVVEAKKAAVDRAESNLKNKLRKLRQSVILAPRAGIVVYATVGQGDQARKIQEGMVPFEGMDLMYLPDIGSMLVNAEINEVDLDKVQIGQPVEIRLDAFRNVVFHGKVKKIGTLAHRKINPATGKPTNTKVFDLVIKVTEEDKRLKPGLSAVVDIIVGKLENVLYVPVEAVFTTENNRTYVYLKKGAKIEKRLVEVGESNEQYVEIKSGLKEGDIVLLSEPF